MMGFSPSEFWTMSLVEWRAALSGTAERHGGRHAASMGRAEFESLLLRFPDRGA